MDFPKEDTLIKSKTMSSLQATVLKFKKESRAVLNVSSSQLKKPLLVVCTESDFAEELRFENKASKKPHMKIHIIGKHELDNGKGKSSEHLFHKRSRGSFLHMDGNESSHMLKRLKASEDIFSGSRTTKHFLFRNEDMAKATEGASRDAGHASGSGSVFNVI